MKRGFRTLFFLGGLVALLALFAGCQHGPFQGGGGNMATIVNQTQHTLEVQENGTYAASIGTGETHNIRQPRRGDGPITALVLAYDEGGSYAGAAYRTFRPRGFVVWEVGSDTLRKADD